MNNNNYNNGIQNASTLIRRRDLKTDLSHNSGSRVSVWWMSVNVRECACERVWVWEWMCVCECVGKCVRASVYMGVHMQVCECVCIGVWVGVCMSVWVSVCVQVREWVRASVWMSVCVCERVSVFIQECEWVCAYKCVSEYVRACASECVRARVWVSVCVHVCEYQTEAGKRDSEIKSKIYKKYTPRLSYSYRHTELFLSQRKVLRREKGEEEEKTLWYSNFA